MLRGLLKLLTCLLALVVLLHVCLWYLQSRGTFARRIEVELHRYVGGDLEVAEAEVRPLARTVVARGVVLRAAPGAPPALFLPEMEMQFPLGTGEGGQLLPSWIAVRRPELTLEEREDGTFSPLDLLKPFEPAKVVPVVTIEHGTLSVLGRGPFSRFLDRILRAGLERKLGNVALATFPQPSPAQDLLGFNGTLELASIATVGVRGGIGRDESLHAEVEVDGLDLAKPSLRQALDQGLARFLDNSVPAGSAHLSLLLDAGVGVPGGLSLSGRLKVADLAFVHETLGEPLTGIDLSATFDGAALRLEDAVLASGDDRLRIDGVIDDVFAATDWRVTLRGEELDFDRNFTRALVQPDIRRAIDDYAPTGTFDLFIEAAARAGGAPEVRYRVEPRDASGSFVGHVSRLTGKPMGFPYRLQQLRGEVAGDGDRLEIRSVNGLHDGGGRITIDGYVDLSVGGDVYGITVQGTGVPINDKLRAGLEHTKPGAGAVLDRFHAEGAVDLFVENGAPNGGASTTSGRISTRGAKFRFDSFPYPLDAVEGTVEFVEDVFHIRGVRGRHGAAEIEVNGTVVAGDDDVSLDLVVAARNVSLADPELRATLDDALPKLLQRPFELFQRFDLVGAVDLEVEVKKELGADPRIRALVWPRGVKLMPNWLPVPLRIDVGRAEFGTLHEDPADRRFYAVLEDIAGSFEGAAVACSGSFGDGVRTDLDVRVFGLPLTPELHQLLAAAEQRGALGSLALEERLRPLLPWSGHATVHYTREDRGDPAAAPAERATIALEDVSVAAEVLPGRRLEHLSGRLDVDLAGARLSAPRLEGALAGGNGSMIARNVDAAFGGGGLRAAAALELRDLSFSEALLPLVHPRLRAFLAARQPAGRIDVAMDALSIELPAGASGPDLDFEGSIDFTDCSIREPLRATGIGGRLLVSGGGLLADDGDLAVSGRFADFAVEVGGAELRGVNGRLHVDRDRIRFEQIGASFAGGTVDPASTYLRFDSGAGDSVTGRVRLAGADVGAILEDLGGGPGKASGQLSADFRFQGEGSRLSSFGGDGRVRVEDGDLWDLPVLAALYRFSVGFVLGASHRPRFSTVKVDFHVADGAVFLDPFELESPLLSVTGRGVMGKTGIDLRVVPRVVSVDVPLLSPLIGLLKGGLLSYRVYGSPMNPRVVYWNLADDVMGGGSDVTALPRLPPRPLPDWQERF